MLRVKFLDTLFSRIIDFTLILGLIVILLDVFNIVEIEFIVYLSIFLLIVDVIFTYAIYYQLYRYELINKEVMIDSETSEFLKLIEKKLDKVKDEKKELSADEKSAKVIVGNKCIELKYRMNEIVFIDKNKRLSSVNFGEDTDVARESWNRLILKYFK